MVKFLVAIGLNAIITKKKKSINQNQQFLPTPKTDWCLDLMIRAIIMSGRHRFKCYRNYIKKKKFINQNQQFLCCYLFRKLYESYLLDHESRKSFFSN